MAKNSHFPTVSVKTVYKWMKTVCNFKYKKQFKKPVFLERTDIVAQREKYLRSIKKYRSDGYKIFYTDETWTSPDQVRNDVWQCLLSNEEIQEFKKQWAFKVVQSVEGWTGGFKVTGGQSRTIINHIGSEDGFLEGAEDVFLSKKDTRDYHNTMNGEHYQDWLKTKVLPRLPDKSVIVLDQAPYHRNRVEFSGMPKMSWVKAKIIQWFAIHNIDTPPDVTDLNIYTKAGLIALSKKYPQEERLVIEDIIEDYNLENCANIKLLFLPVAHCELNPIEIVWAFLKAKVSELNTRGGSRAVLELTNNCIKLVTPKIWQGCIKKAIQFEEKFWIRDHLIDKNLDDMVFSNPNLVINISGETSDSDSSSLDASESD